MFNLQEEIQLWLGDLQSKGSFSRDDLDELKSHLLDQIDDLQHTGLDEEEAYLISIKRLGQSHRLVREYSTNRVQKLWKQLTCDGESIQQKKTRRQELIYLFIALTLGIFMSSIPSLTGHKIDSEGDVYFFNLSFYSILPIGLWFFLKNSRSMKNLFVILPVFLIAFLMNFITKFNPEFIGSNTRILSTLHMPLSLWLAFGIMYAGDKWKEPNEQMNYLRFTGETFIYSLLIGLGAMVVLGLTFGLFSLINIDLETIGETWLFPLVFPAVMIIAAYLAEKKKNIVENFAPVLAKIFSPLFFITLLIFFVFALKNMTLLFEDREFLIIFDVVLVIVLALVIYTISARRERNDYGFYDILNFLLITIALLVNSLALAGIISRLSDFGLSPNKLAAFGENILLLMNLGALGIFYLLFFFKKIVFHRIIWLQGLFLPLYFIWTYFVTIGFPFIFNFL